jgi:hypothetical protein
MAALPAEIPVTEVLLLRHPTAGVERLPIEEAVFHQLHFSPDGKRLVLAYLELHSGDLTCPDEGAEGPRSLTVVDVESRRSWGRVWGETRSVAVIPGGGGYRAVTGDHQGEVAVWDLDAEESADEFPPPATLALSWHRGLVGHLAVLADGRLLASADARDVVRLWPLADLLAHHGIRR